MGMQQRSVDLLVDLMDAEQHFDEVTKDELRKLISEAVVVFGHLLDQDKPDGPTRRPATHNRDHHDVLLNEKARPE